jgi:tetratricopeptide (TPR) repeat protein
MTVRFNHQSKALIGLLFFLFVPLSTSAQRNNFDKRLQQAAALIREQRITEAEQQLNSILKIAPDEASALNLLGTIRASQGRLGEAEKLFARAIRNDHQLTGAHMNLAYLYLLKGMPEMTIAKLKEVLRLAPNHPEAFHKLTRLLVAQNHFDECISLIESVQPSPTSSASLIVTLGDAYLGKGNASKAEESYLLALGKESHRADALLGVAQAAWLKKDAKTATYYLFRAKSLVGNSPDLLYQYALTALKSAVYDEAQAALEQAIKLKSNEPAYLLALGATWLKKPDIFEAERCFRRALQLQPENAQGQMYLGYALFKQKNYAEARTNLEKSLQSDSNLPESFYYLAVIAQEQNDDAQAIEKLQKLVERFPAFVNANVHIALGSSYLKLKNYGPAKQHLERAARLNPDDPKAHYHLAMLYARLKEPQRAQEEMQIVERLKNSHPQTVEGDTLTPPIPRRN